MSKKCPGKLEKAAGAQRKEAWAFLGPCKERDPTRGWWNGEIPYVKEHT